MGKVVDITGEKFGLLTVLGLHGLNEKKKTLWECLCDCGNKTIVLGDNLKRSTKSCGCLRVAKSTTHGGSYTTEYNTWHSMINRCCNPNNKDFINYGGRGITVCERWKSDFNNFVEDMGKKPSKYYSIDRADVNGNYEPSNCKWATRSQQERNKRLNNKNNTGHRGVRWIEKESKWRVQITANNKAINVGTFGNIEDAINARKEAERKYWASDETFEA